MKKIKIATLILSGFFLFVPMISKGDRIIRNIENLSNVWARIKTHSRFDGEISYIESLNNIDLTAFTPAIENDIVQEFTKDPTQQKALFLGFCSNKISLKVLHNNLTNTDKRIARAVKLALARREGSPYQNDFIAEVYAHPSCSNYYSLWVQYAGPGKGLELLHTMKYINTPQTITILLGIFIVSPDKLTKPKEGSLSMIDFPPEEARKYLKGISIEMPAEMDQQKRIVWWSTNKDAVLKRLESTKPLPEITMPELSYMIF